jgi:arsenate reductase
MASPYRILILCTGNSCRSIMAEAILNQLGKGQIHAVSAGSHPRGEVDPSALDVLRRHGVPAEGLRSKSWDEHAQVPVDLVITVCDQAAGEACPWFPGQKVKVHMGMTDPSKVTGTPEKVRAAYDSAFQLLKARLARLVALDMENMGPKELLPAISAIAELVKEESGFQKG